MTPARLEPAAPQSRVKHSTTEPLPSLLLPFGIHCNYYHARKFKDPSQSWQKDLYIIGDLAREYLKFEQDQPQGKIQDFWKGGSYVFALLILSHFS